MLQALKKNENNDEGLGRSRGGFSSKIHCIVDGLGNPVDFILTVAKFMIVFALKLYFMEKMLILLLLIKHMIAIKFLTLLHGWKLLLRGTTGSRLIDDRPSY